MSVGTAVKLCESDLFPLVVCIGTVYTYVSSWFLGRAPVGFNFVQFFPSIFSLQEHLRVPGAVSIKYFV